MKIIDFRKATGPPGPAPVSRQRPRRCERPLACWPVAGALLAALSVAGCGGMASGAGGGRAHHVLDEHGREHRVGCPAERARLRAVHAHARRAHLS